MNLSSYQINYIASISSFNSPFFPRVSAQRIWFTILRYRNNTIGQCFIVVCRPPGVKSTRYLHDRRLRTPLAW